MNGRQRSRQPRNHLSRYSRTRWRFFRNNPEILHAIRGSWNAGAETLPVEDLQIELEAVERA